MQGEICGQVIKEQVSNPVELTNSIVTIVTIVMVPSTWAKKCLQGKLIFEVMYQAIRSYIHGNCSNKLSYITQPSGSRLRWPFNVFSWLLKKSYINLKHWWSGGKPASNPKLPYIYSSLTWPTCDILDRTPDGLKWSAAQTSPPADAEEFRLWCVTEVLFL